MFDVSCGSISIIYFYGFLYFFLDVVMDYVIMKMNLRII